MFLKKINYHFLVSISLFTIFAFSAMAFTFSLLSPPVYGQTANAWNIHRVGTDLNFYYSTNGSSALQLNSNGQMRARTVFDLDNASFILDPSATSNLNSLNITGNLGVGTTTPAAKLDVNGMAILGSSTAGGLKVSSSGAQGVVLSPSVGNGNIRITDDSTSAARGINIANGGSLGIRTASPVSDLHIKQTANSQYVGGITVERSDTTDKGAVFMGGDNKLYFMSGAGYLTVDTFSRLDVKGNTRIDGKLAANGYEPGACGTNYGLCVGGPSGGQSVWTNTSDARLKKNITPISNALDKVLALQGVYFDFIETDGTYKTLPKGRQLGYIAQQVEPIIPEVVTTGGDGMKMMSYANITALLGEGIKEQQSQIEAQNKKVEEQNTMIKSLSEEITSLKQAIEELKK